MYQHVARNKGAANKAHYLIRAQYNRKTSGNEAKKIKDLLLAESPLGEIQIKVSDTKKNKPRLAKLFVYASQMKLGYPDKYQKNNDADIFPKVSAIYCIEPNPPKGEAGIEWLLLTDLDVNTYAQAYEKIQWYCCRWQIEIFFKVMKSGCKIEKLQLTDKNFSVCLAFYLIISWRILFSSKLGRLYPDVSCELVFNRREWQTAYVVYYKKKPPSQPPSLKSMTRLVAALGGFSNRNTDPDPGVKTIWTGMRAMQEHIKARDALELAYGNTYG